MPTRLTRWLNARKSRWLFVVYALLMIGSNLVQFIDGGAPFEGTPADAQRAGVPMPRMNHTGPVGGEPMRVSYLEWTPDSPDPAAAPVLMLHGSPGSATNFRRLAPIFTAAGRRVIAPDLPGFGESEKWIPDYSIVAHAHAVLALMDELGIDRAHVLGFSMGGGVAAHMIDIAPERVASMVMLASIGAQEAEGSGNYWFEHAKYAAGYLGLVVMPEVVPHFGLLGPRWFRHGWIRNFWDTDQRPMRAMLKQIEIPTLIVHGRNDPLVPAWGAELHHSLIRSSALVMLEAGHFLPFLGDQPALVAEHTLPFLLRHDAPSVAPLRYSADFDPAERARRRSVDLGPFEVLNTTPWWVLFLLILCATWITEDGTVIAVGVLIAHGQIDWGVGLLGCFVGIVLGDGGLWALGRFAGRRALRWPFVRSWVTEQSLDQWGRWFDRHTIKAVFVARAVPGLRLPTYFTAGLLSKRTHGFLFWAALAAFLWTPILLGMAIFLGPRLLDALHDYVGGPLGIVLSIVVILIAWRILTESFTWRGRRKIARDLKKIISIEFWPRWAFYTPLVPGMIYQAIRRGPMTFTCVNPDISRGGGVVGESKAEIFEGLQGHSSGHVVPTHLIAAGKDADARTDEVDRLVREDAALAGYPVILKPDESQLGHGFKVIRSREDARIYFADMTRAALLQSYHPGPHEVGVLWARDLIGGRLGDRGRIFSVTRKEFPTLIGDGVSTIEQLIWKHRRRRLQAEVFLKRLADRLEEIPPAGAEIRVGVAGNHAQGTVFTDGADLITPALEARIDDIARNFSRRERAPGEIGGLDFGRFDIRYTSDDALRRGEGFAIVELNGTMSESTNMYDPNTSGIWTYKILYRQWSTLYRLGLARRRTGVRPMSPMDLVRAVRDHFRGRPGSSVAD